MPFRESGVQPQEGKGQQPNPTIPKSRGGGWWVKKKATTTVPRQRKTWRYQAKAKNTILWRGGWVEGGRAEEWTDSVEVQLVKCFLKPLPHSLGHISPNFDILTSTEQKGASECMSTGLLWAEMGVRLNLLTYEGERWWMWNGEAYGRHRLVSKFKYYSRKK